MDDLQKTSYDNWLAADIAFNEAIHGGDLEEILTAREKLLQVHREMNLQEDN